MQDKRSISVIQFKNIRKEKRVCCKCGGNIYGLSHFWITVIGRGKYLCRDCAKEAHNA